MAVSSTNRKAGPFLGNDVAVTFPFIFKVFLTSDLLVESIQAGAVDSTVLVLNSDYTAVLNADQDTDPGGSITLTAGPLATGNRLIITSNVPELQEVVLTNLGGFFPDVLNGALDRLTILVQQLQVDVNRSVKFPLTDNSEVVDLPSAEQRAGKFLYFGSDGSASLLPGAPAETGATQFFAGVLLGTKNGINKTFTVTNGGAPIGLMPVQATVWLNFPLIPGVGYNLGPSPGQVTFTEAPVTDDSLFAAGVFSA
ncbi:MAG TPA: hypothetical protein VK638_06075 [Edaphobacter sp.]|nr:hypothetical protein [Edaphobacter sp.]